MTVAIDFSPAEEEQLARVARHEGLEPAAFVKKLVRDRLPPGDPTAQVQALLARWQPEDGTPLPPPVATRPGETPTGALFRTWDEEDAAMTDEERQAEDRLWQDFERGLDETRAALGMRRLS